MSWIQAMSYLARNAETIRDTRPPFEADVARAYSTLPQHVRSYVQSLLGEGKALPIWTDNETQMNWTVRIAKLPQSETAIKNMMNAVRAGVYLEVPEEVTDRLVDELTLVFQDKQPRLRFLNGPVGARQKHVVELEGKKRLIFPRVLEMGIDGPIEIQSNLCGPIIQRNLVGMLDRATMRGAGWDLKPGWWIVQVGSGGAPPDVDNDGAGMPPMNNPGR